MGYTSFYGNSLKFLKIFNKVKAIWIDHFDHFSSSGVIILEWLEMNVLYIHLLYFWISEVTFWTINSELKSKRLLIEI